MPTLLIDEAFLCILLVFVIPLPLELPGSPILFFLAILAEFIIGAMIGFLTQLLILGIEFGGSIMDTQAGLSVASLLDPSTGQTTSILSRLVRHISILVFFIINGHHVVLGTLVQSFRAIPITSKLNIYEALKEFEKRTAPKDVAALFGDVEKE